MGTCWVLIIFFFTDGEFDSFPCLWVQCCDVIPVGKAFHLYRECRSRQLKHFATSSIIKLGEWIIPSPPFPDLLCAWKLSFLLSAFSSPNHSISFNFSPWVTAPRTDIPVAPHQAAQWMRCRWAIPAAAYKCLLWWESFLVMISTWDSI